MNFQLEKLNPILFGKTNYERSKIQFYTCCGTVKHSGRPDWIGKQIVIEVQVLPNDNCDVSLTIGDTPVQGLLPAIQKVRDKNGP